MGRPSNHVHPTLFLAVKESVSLKSRKTDFLVKWLFHGQATEDDKVRESGSTLIAIFIILEC